MLSLNKAINDNNSINKILYKIANNYIIFYSDEIIINNMISFLLREHLVEKQNHLRDNLSLHKVKFILGDFGKKKEAILIKKLIGKSCELEWGIPSESIQWSNEQFFYRILYPVLLFLFPLLGIIRLHASLIYDDLLGGILVIGNRGAGKSTIAAVWLENNSFIATDDTVLISLIKSKLTYYGLHRELHIDPSMCNKLQHLKNLNDSKEYLPGTNRLSYDWLKYFPNNRINSLNSVKTIILSSIRNDQENTTIKKIVDKKYLSNIYTFFINENDSKGLNPNISKKVLNRLLKINCWRIEWGKDIWSYANMHYSYIKEKLYHL